MNDSVKKLLKESMWDLATCANGTSVVPILQSICRWSGIFFTRKKPTRRCPSASGAITAKGEI